MVPNACHCATILAYMEHVPVQRRASVSLDGGAPRATFPVQMVNGESPARGIVHVKMGQDAIRSAVPAPASQVGKELTATNLATLESMAMNVGRCAGVKMEHFVTMFRELAPVLVVTWVPCVRGYAQQVRTVTSVRTNAAARMEAHAIPSVVLAFALKDGPVLSVPIRAQVDFTEPTAASSVAVTMELNANT